MSLDAFFAHPGTSKKKKRDCKKEAKANATKASTSQNDMLEMEDGAEYVTDIADFGEHSEQQYKYIVECVTTNREDPRQQTSKHN